MLCQERENEPIIYPALGVCRLRHKTVEVIGVDTQRAMRIKKVVRNTGCFDVLQRATHCHISTSRNREELAVWLVFER
jgi:hypothetical protein